MDITAATTHRLPPFTYVDVSFFLVTKVSRGAADGLVLLIFTGLNQESLVRDGALSGSPIPHK